MATAGFVPITAAGPRGIGTLFPSPGTAFCVATIGELGKTCQGQISTAQAGFCSILWSPFTNRASYAARQPPRLEGPGPQTGSCSNMAQALLFNSWKDIFLPVLMSRWLTYAG